MREFKWTHSAVLVALVGVAFIGCRLDGIDATRSDPYGGRVGAPVNFNQPGLAAHSMSPVRAGHPNIRHYPTWASGNRYMGYGHNHNHRHQPGVDWHAPPAASILGRSDPSSLASTTTVKPRAATSTTTRVPTWREGPTVGASTTTTTTTTIPTSTTVKPVVHQKLNLTEVCSHVSVNAERQLLAYVSSIESITGTIQELDEVVQQMRPKSCEHQAVASTVAPTATTMSPMYAADWANSARAQPIDLAESSPPFTPEITPSEFPNSSVESVSTSDATTHFKTTTTTTTTQATTTAGDPGEADATTEPFFDSPSASTPSSATDLNMDRTRVEGRARRADSEPHFGMPVPHAHNQDPAGEDLIRASEDLKALRRDLSSTAEMLKQTNHSVHSALLRALLSYVSSIERRIDSQRVAYVQARSSAALRLKIGLIKEKMAVLLEKLKSIIPFGHSTNSSPYGPVINNA